MNMDPGKIPFNALIVGPTNSGKSRFVVDQLYGLFRGKFDYIVLICPTFTHNKTYHRLGENDPRMDVIVCEQHAVEKWLRLLRWLHEGTNTLIILDDCAASKDVKRRTGELVNLAFSARHMGIRRRQRGRVVSVSDSQSSGPGFESRSDHYLDLFLGSPKFKSSAMLVNSLLVCLWPVGILNNVNCYVQFELFVSVVCSAPLALVLKHCRG